MHKLVASNLIFLLIILGWSTQGVGESPPAPRGEVHIVDPHHYNWATIVLTIFEHLIELDKVVKNRGARRTVFGQFNMREAGSP